MTQMNASILVRLRDQLSGRAKVMTGALTKMNRVGRGIKSWARDASQRFEAMEERMARLGQMTFVFDQMKAAGRSMTGFLTAPISAAMSLQEAMAEVAKVTDFDAPGLKAFEKDLLALSRVPGMPSAGELAQIAAQGAQGGISQDDLLGYTRSAAMMGTAFDMAGDQSGKAFIGFRKIFGLSNDAAFQLGGTVNLLSNNMAANAAAITRVMNRSGAQAEQFGLSAEQNAALAASFLELQVPPEVAGTAINAMLVKLQTFDKQGPKFAAGLRALGISGEDFRRKMKANPQRALNDFLKAVEDTDEKTSILFDLFGQEYVDDVSRLVGGIDSYRKAQRLSNDTTGASISLTEEFESRAATARMKLKALNHAVGTIAVNIGGPFLNAVSAIAGKLAAFSGWVADLIAKFPFLSTVVFSVLGALGALLTIIGTLGTALITAAGFVSLLNWSLITLRLTFLKTAAAFLFSPWGLVIAGIALAALLIIKNWDKIKIFFGKLWGWLVAGLKTAFNWFLKFAGFTPLGLIVKAWKPLTGWFSNLFKGVANTIKSGMEIATKWVLGPIRKMKELLGLKRKADSVFSDQADANHAWQGLKTVHRLAKEGKLGAIPLAGIDGASGLAPNEVAARGGASSVQYNDQSTTTIVQQPGEDMDGFVRRAADERERRQRRVMSDVL